MLNTPWTFEHKNAVVIGGGKGIGRGIAVAFAKLGATVAVLDIDVTAAEAAAEIIHQQGGRAIALPCDVTQDGSLEDALEKIEAQLGDYDLVVNNVGVIVSGNPQDIPFAEWQRIIDLNLNSVLRCNQIVLPKFIERQAGYLVNTASFSGLYPYASNRIPYAVSKSAVITLSETLALYLLPQGIRVSCFCPGPVRTDLKGAMKIWSDNAIMSGPGCQFGLLSVDQAVEKLVDGMLAGKIFIPTHPQVLAEMSAHAADPDAYILNKIAAIKNGDLGLPGVG